MQPALAREPEAFRALMREHNQALFRTARAILRDDAEAEEAVQEAWMQAYKGLGNFRGDAKISTWLIRIAANEALGRLRRRKRTAEVIPMSIDDSPDEGARENMPDQFRAVFVLRAVEELSVEETAVALDIPEATVRTRFFRARSLLRESLSREMDMAVESAFEFLGARCDRITAAVMARIRGPAAPVDP